jgi:hypothetical protein
MKNRLFPTLKYLGLVCVIILGFANIVATGGGGGSSDGGGDGSGTGDENQNSTASLVTWLGYYQSSLIEEDTPLYVEMDQSGTSFSGSFMDQSGQEGTINGTITDEDVTLRFTQTTQGCNGTFTGEGIIDTAYLPRTNTIFFDFSGTDCNGTHTDGSGMLIMKKSDVLVWGLYNPTEVTYYNGDLFWSDSSLYPLKKLNLATSEITPLALLMNSVFSLNLSGDKILWTADIGWHRRLALMIADAYGTNNHVLSTGYYTGAAPSPTKALSNDTYVYWATFKERSQAPYIIERVTMAGGDPVTIAQPGSGFRGMAIDDDYLYWAESTNIFRYPHSGSQQTPETVFSGDRIHGNIALNGNEIVFATDQPWEHGSRYKIVNIPKSGGTVTELADELILMPTRVLVDDKAVYWLNAYDRLQSVPLDGGDVTTLLDAFHFDGIEDIALSATQVYLVARPRDYPTNKGIYYLDKNGGSINELSHQTTYAQFVLVDDNNDIIYADGGYFGEPTGIYRVTPSGAVNKIMVGIDGSSNLAVNDQFIFTTQGFAVKRIGHEGGNATVMSTVRGYEHRLDCLVADENYVYFPYIEIVRVPNDEPGSSQFVAEIEWGIDDLQVNNGFVYWIDDNDKIYRAPVYGGTRQLIADDLDYATNFVVDDQFVYVIESDGRSLTKVSVGGGNKTSISSTDLPFGWFSMAQDSECIYWSTRDGFFKVDKSGDNWTKYDMPGLLYEHESLCSLAVDDNYLYWTDQLTGSVQRVPK